MGDFARAKGLLKVGLTISYPMPWIVMGDYAATSYYTTRHKRFVHN